MNTIFNNPFYKKKFFFLIVVLLLCGNSIAQVKGPFSEIPVPPSSDQIWTNPSGSTSSNTEIKMNNTILLESNPHDGILLNFKMHIGTQDEDIASFVDENYINDPVISICYSNELVYIRRRYKDDNNSIKSYDYKLYDQLFGSSANYEIKLYMTANFIFIVTQKIGTEDKYLSPVFFGLDISDNKIMKNFIDRSEKAIIKVGGANTSVSDVKLYAFSYNRKNSDKGIYEGLLPNIKKWNKKLYVKE